MTNTTTVRTYVVPLHDRCVIDGLGTTTLFSVGNETAAACRWPQPRPARRRRSFGAATASLADVSVRGNGNGRSKRWFDDSAGSDAVDDFSDHGFVVTTATGGYSPWGRSSGGDANETAESDTNECGRLNLKGLVLRGGWSGTKNGVAVSNFGGEVSIAGCVVERHRTGVGSGRGGAVANRGGSVEILHSIFAKTSRREALRDWKTRPARLPRRTRETTCSTTTPDHFVWMKTRGSTGNRGGSPRRKKQEGKGVLVTCGGR